MESEKKTLKSWNTTEIEKLSTEQKFSVTFVIFLEGWFRYDEFIYAS